MSNLPLKSLPTICEEFATRWATLKSFKREWSYRSRREAYRKFYRAIDQFNLPWIEQARAMHDTLQMAKLKINADEVFYS